MSPHPIEAFADETTYQYNPFGFIEPPRERIRVARTIQHVDIQAFLMGEISKALIVVQPLQITIEQDEDKAYIVSDDIFLVYGVGDDSSEALGDYVESLIKYFEIIENSAETNKFDKALLGLLHSYIQRRGHDAVQTNRS